MATSKLALKEFVVKGRSELALNKIVAATKHLQDQYFHNQAAALSGHWNANERVNNVGNLSAEEYNLEKANITEGVLALIDQLPERPLPLK